MASDRMTASQWRAFVAAWLGWCFDGLDGYLYALVAISFVTTLMPGAAAGDVQQHAAWIQGAFLVGWALGGAFFGRMGDKIGRTRTLTLTILTYAVFTGLSFFAQTWWHLLIFRFVAALGIGGEWAAGSALVSETLGVKHRSWASATLQSGYMVGIILAAITVGALGSLPPKFVFLVGIVPALMTVWIRKAVPEPEEWERERHTRTMPRIGELFGPEVRATTLKTLALTSIALTTVWGFIFFSVQLLIGLPEVAALAPPDKAALVRNVVVVYSLWNIVGNFLATYLARAVGNRRAFAALMLASGAMFLLGFREAHDLETTKWIFNAAMFFSAGLFAIFPLYIPPLFPTLLRTTGSGFSYNFGRLAAAAGTLLGGWITAKAGGPGMAIWWLGFLYVPGLAVSLAMPEGPHEVVPS
ncbi:MAG: MFS transporter [Fimbriimonadaceae bacterium]|nr:MFS transporter [Fimbriimonadaceae bacterium]